MTVELLSGMSTVVIHTCEYPPVHCGQECAQHAADLVGHEIGDSFEWGLSLILLAAKCSGGCYCVKDRFAW